MKALSNLKTHAVLFVAALAIGLSTTTAHAQYQTERAQFDAPFAFQYGSHLLPAGRYVVSRQYSRVLLITDGPHSVMGPAQIAEDRKPVIQGKIVFEKHGDRYFLSQVWTPGKSSHLTCNQSKAEREAEKEAKVASNATAPSSVELALINASR